MDKLKLTAELNKSNNQATETTQLKELAEEEVIHLNQIIQAAELDKQQQVQNLTDMVEYFRNTTVKSVDEFINRLKLC